MLRCVASGLACRPAHFWLRSRPCMRWRSRRAAARAAPGVRRCERGPARRRAPCAAPARPRPAGTLPNFDDRESNELPALRHIRRHRGRRHRLRFDQPRRPPNCARERRRPTVPGRPRQRPLGSPRRASPTATLPRPTAIGHVGALGRRRRPGAAQPAKPDANDAADAGTPRPRRAIRWCAFLTARAAAASRHGEHPARSTRRPRCCAAAPPSRRIRSPRSACMPARSCCLPAIETTGGYDTNPARMPSGRRLVVRHGLARADREIRLGSATR